MRTSTAFDHTKYTLEYDKLSVMDKWILSRLNTTIKVVDKQLSNYEITEASKTLQKNLLTICPTGMFAAAVKDSGRKAWNRTR